MCLGGSQSQYMTQPSPMAAPNQAMQLSPAPGAYNPNASSQPAQATQAQAPTALQTNSAFSPTMPQPMAPASPAQSVNGYQPTPQMLPQNQQPPTFPPAVPQTTPMPSTNGCMGGSGNTSAAAIAPAMNATWNFTS